MKSRVKNLPTAHPKNRHWNFGLSPFGFLLAACGAGTGKKLPVTQIDDSNPTLSIDNVNTPAGLSNYTSLALHNYQGIYSDTDVIRVLEVDQSMAQNYLSEYSDLTSTKKLSGKNEIDGLLHSHWSLPDTTKYFWRKDGSETVVSYSFFNKDLLLLDEASYRQNALLERVYDNDFYSFTDIQKSSIREALAEFEEVINVRFVEVSEQTNQVGSIRFGISQHDFGSTAAIASSPHRYWADGGDIWLDGDHYKIDIGKGTYAFHVLLHEIGHAMGLGHPKDDIVLNSDLDFHNFTHMSHEPPTWGHFGSGDNRYYTVSESLMVYDILALQYYYGANISFNEGNTKYQFVPSKPTSLTIWDAGGEDTIDLSNFRIGCKIDINDGSYSTIEYSGWNAEKNLGIAFDTFIENVSGSQGNDIIVGNELNNEILGNNGDDLLYGGAGDDIFNWKSDSRGGRDTLYGEEGDDIFFLSKYSNDIVVERFNEGHDIIYIENQNLYNLPANIEEVRGLGSLSLNLNGNELDNILRGGPGDDILTGSAGADDFLLYFGMGRDIVTDFDVTEGDEVLLAFGLAEYSTSYLDSGLLYFLSDGSSLELQYEVLV